MATGMVYSNIQRVALGGLDKCVEATTPVEEAINIWGLEGVIVANE